MMFTPPIRSPQSAIRNRSEAGVALITTLLLVMLLLIAGTSGMVLSRTDLLISQNLLTGTQALWLARAGAELGKNWLEMNLSISPLPVTVGPQDLANGSYTVDIGAQGSGLYHLTAVGLGPGGSERIVEETVQVPDFTPLGVVTSDGDGLHPDFDDNSGGTGRRIPDFSIDGRNHAADGTLTPSCPDIAPFAATDAAAQNDLIAAANELKRQIVTRANAFCLADGSSSGAGPCTPGLFWVRGAETLPRFTDSPCVMADPPCFLNLDLAAPALRATAVPPSLNLPEAPDNRGPFAPSAGTLFVQTLNVAERDRLRTAVGDILARAEDLPDEKRLQITTSLSSGSHAYGTMAEPKVTHIEDGAGALEFSGGAVISGAGVLIIPRPVHLRDATLNWQGVVLIVEDGDLRVEAAAACGQVVGAIVIRDDATPDRKLDLDRIERGACSPFALHYSCETVTHALRLLMRTVSWIEDLGA
jgi:hypothetical protein